MELSRNAKIILSIIIAIILLPILWFFVKAIFYIALVVIAGGFIYNQFFNNRY